MAPNVTLHFFANNDLNGSPVEVLTDEDPRFLGLGLKMDRDSLGGAVLRLQRAKAGDFTEIAAETFVRLIVHAYSDTVYYPWAFFLNKRDLTVIHRDEDGGEEIVFGGAGPKMYLTRHALGIVDHLGDGGWHLNLDAGVWRWGENATVGGILRRIILEDAARGDPALPDLTFTFDSDDDSDGVPWADTALAGADSDYEIPIGQDLLSSLWDLGDVVDLSSWIDLGTVASPKFELNVIQGFGEDRTGSVFGSGVCLLKEGVNIVDDALVLEGKSIKKASHVIVEGKDGAWEVAERPSFSPGDYVKYAKIEYQRSSKHSVLEKAGLRWLRRQDNGEKEIAVEILPGASDATGLYFPAPDRVLWLDNLISVDTSADGTTKTATDLSPSEDQLVTGLELSIGEAGDTATADAKAKSWRVLVHLNQDRQGTVPGSPDQASAAGGGGKGKCRCGNHTHPQEPPEVEFPPECEVQEPDTVTPIADYSDDGGGSLTSGDSCWGADNYRLASGAGFSSGNHSVSAGDVVRGTVEFRNETGDDPWEDVANYNYEAYIKLEGTSVVPIITHIIDQRFHNAGCIAVTRSADVTVPSGYDSAKLVFASRLGGYKARWWLDTVEFSVPPDNDPFCIPEGTGGESPYPPRSDDPRFDADDQHLITALKSRAVNNSGGVLAAGDVVIADPTFTDGNAVTTTTDAAQSAQRVGLVLEGIDEDAVGIILWEGLVRIPVNGASGASDLDYLFTSSTPGEADTDNVRAEGAFGQVIFDDADAPYIQWWGVPDPEQPDTSAAPISRVVKTADETVNNSAALQADNHLTLAVAANKRYGWRANLWFSSGTTPDIQWEFIVPSGATGQYSGMGLGTAGADNEGPTYAYGAGVGGPDDQGQGVGVKRHRRFEGFLKTSSTAGNLALNWAQNSANATDTVVYEGSTLELWEL